MKHRRKTRVVRAVGTGGKLGGGRKCPAHKMSIGERSCVAVVDADRLISCEEQVADFSWHKFENPLVINLALSLLMRAQPRLCHDVSF